MAGFISGGSVDVSNRFHCSLEYSGIKILLEMHKFLVALLLFSYCSVVFLHSRLINKSWDLLHSSII